MWQRDSDWLLAVKFDTFPFAISLFWYPVVEYE